MNTQTDHLILVNYHNGHQELINKDEAAVDYLLKNSQYIDYVEAISKANPDELHPNHPLFVPKLSE